MIRFDGSDDQLSLPASSGTDTFTVFAVVKASASHEIDGESNGGYGGVSGQHYLFFPTYGGSDAGAGLSVGTNGLSVYEHGGDYLPALAVYSGAVGSDRRLVTVAYRAKKPSIRMDGTVVRDGITSPRAHVFAPQQIGGGNYGCFSGDVEEVLIYNNSLSDAGMAAVESYLGRKYGMLGAGEDDIPIWLDANGEPPDDEETPYGLNPNGGGTEDGSSETNAAVGLQVFTPLE